MRHATDPAYLTDQYSDGEKLRIRAVIDRVGVFRVSKTAGCFVASA